MKEMSAAKWFGLFLKIVLAGVVAVFVGSESLAFFNFIFPPEKFYLAYTGFGLTMGAFLVYLYLLLKDAETPLQRVIALLMMVVGLVGELATAGFGMLIEGWTKLGWQPAQSEYEFMILVIRIAVGIHGVSLVMYWFGDTIIELMGDHDGDGTPNFADPDYKAKKNKGSGFRWPWQKPVPAPEPVRQFNTESDEIRKVTIPEDVYKQLLIDAGIGQGGVPTNGHGAVDPTKAAR
jgi:MFS family permease